MTTAREKMNEALGRVAALKSLDRDLTSDELAEVTSLGEQVTALRGQIEANTAAKAALAGIAGAPVPVDDEDEAPAFAGAKSFGEMFTASAGFKSFRKAHPSGIGEGTPVRIEAKAVGGLGDIVGTKAAETITTSTGQTTITRQPGYRSLLEPDLGTRILDLVTTGQTTAQVIEYAQVIAETNNAALVDEGALKPTSDVTTARVDAKSYTYADGFTITNQMLADDGALAAFMDSRIRTHVENKIEDVLLNGAGTSTEPAGILHTTGVQQQAFDTDILTTLARGLEKTQKYVAPQAIVLNPADAWAVRLMQDKTGRYYAGGPFSSAPFTPWGVPVVESYRMPKGTGLVGNFRSINFLEREPLSVLAFNQHLDYAQRNLVYVRAELRGMQLFYAPREVAVVTLAGA